jgi:hypothetical protein
MYKADTSTEYLAAIADLANDGKKEDHVNFVDHVDLKSDVKIDPKTGRITSLCLQKMDYDPNCVPFVLPRIIERLQSLERTELYYCKYIPIELGNLPKLK